MKLDFKKAKLKIVDNEKALYTFAELKDFIDWEVRRVYFIQKTKQNTGQHCHMKEKELFVMVQGSCVAVIDQGNGKKDTVLQAPGDAIYVGNYVWHGFKDFSPDAIVMALSSTNYIQDRSDYIEEYDEYQKIIKTMD